MAALFKHGGDDEISDVPIKSVEIKAATHQEIISVGNDVFQKAIDRQQEQLNEKLHQHELCLIKRLGEERRAALDALRIEHDETVEELKLYYATVQENALKEEASRLCDIMKKLSTNELEAQRLEGQQKLDKALLMARADFDVEKEEALMQASLQHQERELEIEKQNDLVHITMIDKLNKEWGQKYKEHAEKALLHENESLEYEREEAMKSFDITLAELVAKSDKEHNKDLALLKQHIEEENEKGFCLKNDIKSLQIQLEDMKVELKKVLAAFQSFIDRSPGFSPGQSEFILDKLLPGGFDEFISGLNEKPKL